MARIEKTVFISYRRADVYVALAVYEILKIQSYDVFFDYRSISSGDFEQIITSNIRARAHFILILTPTALDRCNEPGDWLRREIELAIDEKRNVVPLFFKGFRFGTPSVAEKLTGKLKNLSHYNGLNVHEDYFDEAMQRLRTQYLNIPLNTILHPVSTEVQKVVKEEQVAADKALEQIEDIQELVKQGVGSPSRKFNFQKNRIITIFIISLLFVFGIIVINYAVNNWPVEVAPTPTSRPPIKIITSTITSIPPTATMTFLPTQGVTPTVNVSFLPPVTGKDGMILLNVPAGEFIMGLDKGEADEKPAHMVYLDAFWVDQTEVTNAMYAKCVDARVCTSPTSTISNTRDNYFGNPDFDNFPVIYVDWNMAKTYCEWVDRRLPTEAEWEKAASWDVMNQHKNTYPWGDSVSYCSLSNSVYQTGLSCVGDTTEVGKYPNGASPYGALDMAGNVWEWVDDWYDAYPSNTVSNSGYGKTNRVLRGSAWSSNFRSTYRYRNSPKDTENYIGFRCAMDATP